LEISLIKATRLSLDDTLSGLLSRVKELEDHLELKVKEEVIVTDSHLEKEKKEKLVKEDDLKKEFLETGEKFEEEVQEIFEEEDKEALEPERVEEIEYKPEKLEIKEEVKVKKKVKEKAADFNFESIQKLWPLVLDELKEKSKPTHAFLLYAMPVKVTDNLIEIQFEPEAKFQMEILEREDHFKKIQDTLSKILGRKVNIHLTVREKEKEEFTPKIKAVKKEKISENEVVELLKAEFDAESMD
ncbi:MAG: hypothetical protein ABIA56_04300, partial [Actinomycetota bacterium]